MDKIEKIENDYIPFWDPLRKKIMLINKEDCKKIQKEFNKFNDCPNFEPKTKEQ